MKYTASQAIKLSGRCRATVYAYAAKNKLEKFGRQPVFTDCDIAILKALPEAGKYDRSKQGQ
jgi:hypothetical protein